MAVLTECFEQYKNAEDLAENSIDIKKRAVDYLVLQFGDVDPNVVTPKMAKQYRTNLSNGMRGKLLNSSKNSYLSNIRPFFKWLQEEEYIQKNPFVGIKLFKEKVKIRETYKPDEITRIFEVMKGKKHELCLKTAFTLALCGMRKNEIFNMIGKDFSILDNGSGEIKISHKEDGKLTWEWSTKGKCERYVPVFDWARDFLLHRISWLISPNPYLAVPDCYWERAMKRLANGTFTKDDRNCAFINFERDFKGVLKAAGVENKTLHTTRATLCMNLHDEGVPVEEAQQILGHKHIETTVKHYMNLDQRKLCQQAGQKLVFYSTFLAR